MKNLTLLHIRKISMYIAMVLLLGACQSPIEQGDRTSTQPASGEVPHSHGPNDSLPARCGTSQLLNARAQEAAANVLADLVLDTTSAVEILADPDSSADLRSDATKMLQDVQEDLATVQAVVAGLIPEED